MSNRAIALCACAITACSLICGAAYAQGTLTVSNQTARTDAGYKQGASNFGNNVIKQDQTGVDFHEFADNSFVQGGFNGEGHAEEGATFTPSSPLIGNQFSSVVLDACSAAWIKQSNIGPHSFEQAHGLALGIIEFSISQPMTFTWVGAWQGQSFNTGSRNSAMGVLDLHDINTSLPYVSQTRLSLNGVGDWNQNFSYSGLLPAGTYHLEWSHETYVLGGATPFGFFPTGLGGGPQLSCIDSTFTLSPTPGAGMVLGLAALASMKRRRG